MSDASNGGNGNGERGQAEGGHEEPCPRIEHGEELIDHPQCHRAGPGVRHGLRPSKLRAEGRAGARCLTFQASDRHFQAKFGFEDQVSTGSAGFCSFPA